MDRRFNADFYSFVSPVVNLREFLEEAYAIKQQANGRHVSNSFEMILEYKVLV
ncbi:hypothetical protein KIN20_006562 [Parelaphostrongylus tenuis]|uniref:Uncharacterized protein n=1 Tax=Parelaphostrongylus tenuis TaxID=148309 RepID=A0AAD5MU90_PARTN|nr:hypothetical protein KIN20_006562 [Parelaphostrongylus tenuis]